MNSTTLASSNAESSAWHALPVTAAQGSSCARVAARMHECGVVRLAASNWRGLSWSYHLAERSPRQMVVRATSVGRRREERVSYGSSASDLAAALPAYTIGPALGAGTFGVVYAARHVALERDAAIKQLWANLLFDDDARSSFASEARLLASLDHPHIVRVYDYVEGKVEALVLEHMGGGTLSQLLRAGTLSAAAACAIVLDLLDGLEYAHQHAILHRDIKPQNLLLNSRGTLKLADFGLAKLFKRWDVATSGPIHRPGTPAYMAPEQVSRSLGRVSAATDVWAVGAVLYEMLAGQRPFADAIDVSEMMIQRLTRDPRPIKDVVPHVPSAVCDVVAKALARLPADRFQSAAEFASALGSASADTREIDRRPLAPRHETVNGEIAII